MTEKLKQVYLKYVKGYGDERGYWDSRWNLGLRNEKLSGENQSKLTQKILQLMNQNGCNSFLDVGCGESKLSGIPGYIGLDFSLEALRKSKLREAIYADITQHIPLPDKSIDMSFASVVFLHVPPAKISKAIAEVCRVTKKCIFLIEPKYQTKVNYQKHCFNHDLHAMIKKQFNGVVVIENST